MECGKDQYYDHGTSSCGFCSQLCHLVDIQGTREDCERLCPGYLTRTTTTTTSPLPSPHQPYNITDNPWFIAGIVIMSAVVLVAALALYWKRAYLIAKFKKQDCCGEGQSKQPHVQETGHSRQPEASSLLANGAASLPSDATIV